MLSGHLVLAGRGLFIARVNVKHIPYSEPAKQGTIKGTRLLSRRIPPLLVTQYIRVNIFSDPHGQTATIIEQEDILAGDAF